MTQIVQTVSCVVDAMLIICFLKYIVCTDIKIGKLWVAVATIIPCAIIGGFVDVYFNGNIGTFPIKLLLPLLFLLITGKGAVLKNVGKYFLALLLFLSAEILSIFIELFIFNAMVGNAVSNNRFLLSSIFLNVAIALLVWHYGSKGKWNIKLSAKEWSLLFCVNVITYLLISAVATDSKIILIQAIPQELLRMTINYSAIFLYIFFVISLINGRIAAHFKEVGQISERHMAEQLKYFSSYKQSQEDTRRFRHDMKNHLLYLQALSAENKTADIKAYIKSLNDKWEELPRLYSTGSDVADTIINAKQFMYEEQHIEVRVIGTFDTEVVLRPIDLCTLLSNAIDNAVKANADLPPEVQRYIEIDIKANRSCYLVTMRNPTLEYIDIENNHVVFKPQQESGHGYGLLNMEQSLKPYGGYLKILSTTNIFTLEIVFPK